jgi:hypothetical protein
MSSDKADISRPLVSRLIGKQFPPWAGLPVTEVRSADRQAA